MRGLIDVAAVQKVGAVWRVVDREAAADIPVTIEAMLLGRVDRLPPAARRMLHHAAMIGPRFDVDLLQALSGRAPVDAVLDLLCDTEIIEETRDGGGLQGAQTYRFTQTLLQEVVYNNLLLSRRTEGHALIGRCWSAGSARIPIGSRRWRCSATISASPNRRPKAHII